MPIRKVHLTNSLPPFEKGGGGVFVVDKRLTSPYSPSFRGGDLCHECTSRIQLKMRFPYRQVKFGFTG